MLRLLLFFFLFPFLSFGQSLLQERINEFAIDPDIYASKTSLCLIDLESGQFIAGYNSQHKLIPASTLKLLTSATALQLFGPHFVYTTSLQVQGSVHQELLLGNLVMYSDGDPGFLSDKWISIRGYRRQEVEDNLLQALIKSGIKKIKGDLIIDASYFDREVIPHGWTHQDIGNYYAAGVWGVSYRDNQYELLFERQSQEDKWMPIAQQPQEVPYLELISEVYSGPPQNGDQSYIYALPFQHKAYVRGSLPSGKGKFGIKGSIPDVPLSLGYWLHSLLEKAKIELEGEIKIAYQKTEQGQEIWAYQSPPLLEYLKIINKESHNLYAEALRRKIEKERVGNFDGIVKDYWDSKGISLDGAFVLDGSGLNSRNNLSAYQLAHITRNAVMDPINGPTFLSTLPLGGREGTVKNLFKQSPAYGKIRLKSGSMERVRAYVGVIEKEGKKVAFAILINDYSCDPILLRHKMSHLMQEFYLFL